MQNDRNFECQAARIWNAITSFQIIIMRSNPNV